MAASAIYCISAAWIVLSLHCLARIHRAYQDSTTLAKSTVAEVCVLYLVHGGLITASAWVNLWPLDFAEVWASAGGVPILLAGLTVLAAGVWQLASFRRMSGMKTDKLVTTGIRRFSRNPQNLGWAVVALGVALLGQSGYALVLVLLFATIFHVYVHWEEALLERMFGDQYQTYRKRAPRYLCLPR